MAVRWTQWEACGLSTFRTKLIAPGKGATSSGRQHQCSQRRVLRAGANRRPALSTRSRTARLWRTLAEPSTSRGRRHRQADLVLVVAADLGPLPQLSELVGTQDSTA